MNIIETIAPIEIEELKKYFADKSITYVIDYNNSKMQGEKLLTYISNLDLPIDIKVDFETEEGQALLKCYLESTFLVNVASLEKAAIAYLFNYRFEEEKHTFVKDNYALFDLWATYLDSCTAYNMYILNDEMFKDFARQLPEERFDVCKGINFVQLLKYEEFFVFYNKLVEGNVKFMPQIFDEYMFKGKNLYSFWANENNPLFLLTWGIASGVVTGSNYAESKGFSNTEITDVSLI